ncbi:MAG: hypothetical protein QOI66_4641 [Myxococcales bacterium]|jgi:hypothetical protein|nr:hypothetical protein [Myxococcales bacterium]
MVTTQAGTVGADAQRIFLSVRSGNTDVVTQVGVPSTTADYGVLIPVPAEPTLDPTPVSMSDLDSLERKTAPTIRRAASDDSPSCGCPLPGGSSNRSAGGDSVQVSAPIAIGPVTAVSITADSGDAINTWLSQNGFAIRPADRPIVDAYSGPGRFFIALRRNDNAATGGATSVGVHFTLPGDQRVLPLGFARLGAASTVAFTVVVAADDVVGPAAPYQALTIDDLDAATVRSAGYARAVTAAVTAHGGRAFVMEGSWMASGIAADIGGRIGSLIAPDSHVTRLSTILPPADLIGDVVFNQPHADVKRIRTVEAASPRAPFALYALGLLFLRRRVRYRR